VPTTGDSTLDRLLVRWQLEAEPVDTKLLVRSRNRTVIARDRSGRRVLVKVDSDLHHRTVAREGVMLEALGGYRRRALSIPRLAHRDAAIGAVAVRWIPDAPNLFVRDQQRRAPALQIARAVGAALGELHRCPLRPEGVDAASVRHLSFFIRVPPDTYATFGPATVQLFSRLQRSGVLYALQELDDERGEPCLLHGDLKRANLLCPRRRAGVVLVDWELAHLGDPATDLGSLLADYATDFVTPAGPSALGADELRALGRALFAGYRGDVSTRRSVQWAGAALLYYVYWLAQFEANFGPRAQALVTLAEECLTRPKRWAGRLT
jgi:tRNA A-37 threonylcarbamoyl transferase component Bud32